MPSTTEHGYSGTPLHRKLGMKPGMRCLVLGAPDQYPDLVAGADGVTFSNRFRSADIVHLFCTRRSELERRVEPALARVVDGGSLWVSWPKKSSPLHRDLAEDDLREIILPLGWVDVKVCAVDADWSGLKFCRRRRRGQ